MLEGITRESIGSASAKRLRRDGYLTANIYANGVENIQAAFKRGDFVKAVRKKETLTLSLKVDDKELKVVIQEYQKDPVKTQLLHVDLMIAQPGIRTYYNVPVTVEGTPKGLKNKGMFIYHKRRVRVKSAIENLPKSFHFQIDELDTGDNFLIRDINFPDGVDCYLDPSVPVVGVIKAK